MTSTARQSTMLIPINYIDFIMSIDILMITIMIMSINSLVFTIMLLTKATLVIHLNGNEIACVDKKFFQKYKLQDIQNQLNY